ncbi:MAG: LysR substrate-binding domain-containing protein [Rhodospirillales bacterium]
MEVFIQVMESGNFTRAADALGLPRSTISTVIQALEDRLGTQLLRRSTRRMVATDEGERFLGTARGIIDAAADAEQMFRQKSSQIRGRLRIDMPSRIGRRFVIPALPALLDQHLDLRIEISTTDRKVDLISEGVDCLIRVGELQNSETICRKLGDVGLITCGSPEYFARFGWPGSVAVLSTHRLVNYDSSLPAQPARFEYQTRTRSIQHPMSSVISVNNAEAYIAAACAGLGLIQIPAFDVQDLLESGTLVPVLQNVRLPTMPLSLMYARRRNVPVRISVFQEWVSDLLHREGVFDPV